MSADRLRGIDFNALSTFEKLKVQVSKHEKLEQHLIDYCDEVMCRLDKTDDAYSIAYVIKSKITNDERNAAQPLELPEELTAEEVHEEEIVHEVHEAVNAYISAMISDCKAVIKLYSLFKVDKLNGVHNNKALVIKIAKIKIRYGSDILNILLALDAPTQLINYLED